VGINRGDSNCCLSVGCIGGHGAEKINIKNIGGSAMSECKLDHSHEDVKNKYESQAEYLPDPLKEYFDLFFQKEHSQELLNEVFHLLKKYDLASDEEKQERNNRLSLVLKNV
jgi:hypothetical protein